MSTGDFVRKRKHLFWSTKNYDGLSNGAVIEAVLNYGDMNDVRELISLLGMQDVAQIFRHKSTPDKFGRQNYRPEIRHYFNLYFNKHANA